MSPTVALSPRDRWLAVRARGSAFLTDSFLVAYLAWTLDFLAIRAAGGGAGSGWLGAAEGVLGERPWLFLLAPLVAALWSGLAPTIGEHLAGVSIARREGHAPVDRARRAWRGLVAVGVTLLALVPAGLGMLVAARGGDPGLHLLLSLAMATLLLALGLFDPDGRGLVDRLAGTTSRPGAARGPAPPRAWWLRSNVWLALLTLFSTFAVAWVLVDVRPGELVFGARRTEPLVRQLLAPDWSIAGQVAESMVETVLLAFLASAFALPFAVALGFLGARNVVAGTPVGRGVYVLARVAMNVVRSVEPLIWAIVFVLWVGVGAFAGMLALFVHSVAALGKLYSEAIEGIEPGPVEAIQATGARAVQTLRYGVVPQVVPAFLSFTLYRWDINVRMATILGLVGGGGIGALLLNYQQLGTWSKVSVILVFITLVVWALDWASSKTRQKVI